MKVKELIEKLQSLDPEHMLVINGYEGGVNEVSEVETIRILTDQNKEWYYGKHEEVGSYDEEKYETALEVYCIA